MNNIFLTADEHIIATDIGLYYWGPLAYNGRLSLTNERLYFEPIGAVDKIAGAKEVSIFVDNIDFIDFPSVDKVIAIQEADKIHRFSGRGAERIIKRLQLRQYAFAPGNFQSPAQMKKYREIVLFQGNAVLNTTKEVGITGQFFITKQDICIENRNHEIIFEFSLTELKGLQFNLLAKTLVLLFPQQQFQLKGNAIPKAFLLLHALHKGGFREQLFCESATLLQGVLGIKGLLQSTENEILFCPTESLDSFANAYLVTFDLRKILALRLKRWPEKRIVLQTATETHQLSAPDVEKLHKRILTVLQQATPTHLAARDNAQKTEDKISPVEVQEIAETNGVQLMEDENILLFSWGVKKETEFDYLCGWLFLTNLRVIFCSVDQSNRWIARNDQISKTPNETSGLGISYKQNQLLFLPADDIHFINRFWNRINLLKPPKDLRGARTGQNLQSVLGKNQMIVVVKEQQDIFHVHDAYLQQNSQGLSLLFSEKQTAVLQKGDTIHLEIPKKQGRFRISSVIKEVHLSTPNKKDQFCILMEEPLSVLVYNKRKAFRLKRAQTLIVSIYHCTEDTYPQFTEDEEEEKNLRLIEKHKLELVDISFGGCKVQTNKNLLALQIPIREMVLRFQLMAKKRRISVQGIIQHTTHVKKPEEIFIHGISFVGLSEPIKKKLFTEILRLEREILRQQDEFLQVDLQSMENT